MAEGNRVRYSAPVPRWRVAAAVGGLLAGAAAGGVLTGVVQAQAAGAAPVAGYCGGQR